MGMYLVKSDVGANEAPKAIEDVPAVVVAAENPLIRAREETEIEQVKEHDLANKKMKLDADEAEVEPSPPAPELNDASGGGSLVPENSAAPVIALPAPSPDLNPESPVPELPAQPENSASDACCLSFESVEPKLVDPEVQVGSDVIEASKCNSDCGVSGEVAQPVVREAGADPGEVTSVFAKPAADEVKEYFASEEECSRAICQRFSEKYNFDFENDKPLEGRYEWVKLK